MRHARILDVLSAVTAVAAGHPEILAWWFAPPQRLRLQGEIARPRQETPPLEVVVQADPAVSTVCDVIAAELSGRLSGSPVTVRLHRGGAEERQLFRLLSGRPQRGRDAAQRDGGETAADRTA